MGRKLRGLAPAVAAAGLVVSGCGRGPVDADGAAAHGRYLGVGTYSPGELWSRMVVRGAAAPPPQAATPADDEHVIVVVDSRTGEIRECGDYSGLCVAMNPWTRAVAASQAVPVTLTKHLSEVLQEQNTRRSAAAPQAASGSSPATPP